MLDTAAIFKAYDIRGTVPDQLDSELCGRIGAAFGAFFRQAEPATREVILGRDMRESGVELSAAFSEGVRSQGLDVVNLGLVSTDMLFFASGHLGLPGVIFTASHNPAGYNGIKSCLSGAVPIGVESGLVDVENWVHDPPMPAASVGTERQLDLLAEFVEHVHSFIDIAALRPLKVVADTANGMGGHVVPPAFADLVIDLEVMFGELDGTFPNHPADPIQPENQADLRARVLEVGADVGLAFDGDADRVFLVDDKAEPVPGSTMTAMVADRVLASEPGATILHNLICSRSVAEVVAEAGGTAVRTRVGHSYIKQIMAETGAAFGGEHSGHYYFRDNYRADSGLIAALVVLELLSNHTEPLSELRKPYERYWASGEINTRVDDTAAVIARVEQHYRDLELDHLDGLTVSAADWWFNLRPSNTEPLLRLNLEAPDETSGRARLDEVQSLIEGTPT